MGLRIEDNASLQRLNTFGVAARARRLIILDDEAQLGEALDAAAAAGPLLVLGGGSNLLFTGDHDGTVLLIRTRGRQVIEPDGGADRPAVVAIKAGEGWDDTVRWTLDQDLPGLENLSMIPGSTGAAAVQNIGAYGVELRDRFHSLRAVHTGTGLAREFGPQDCRFGYRESIFRLTAGSPWLILELRLRVGHAFAPVISYGDLRAVFADRSAPAPAQEVAQAVRAIRARKLPDPARLGNAGSFFKNPLVDVATCQRLLALDARMPAHPASDGGPVPMMKLSAGWLIERCGWKGYRDGDAGVDAGHALVLVNHGAASGRQLADLALRIRSSVHERFGVWLEPEPIIIGGL